MITLLWAICKTETVVMQRKKGGGHWWELGLGVWGRREIDEDTSLGTEVFSHSTGHLDGRKEALSSLFFFKYSLTTHLLSSGCSAYRIQHPAWVESVPPPFPFIKLLVSDSFTKYTAVTTTNMKLGEWSRGGIKCNQTWFLSMWLALCCLRIEYIYAEVCVF